MADNITLNAGTGGAVLATDDISGVHYAINKLAYGALDSATIVSLASGLPVQPGTSTTWAISAASLPLPTGAATAAKQPALGTAGTASADVITVQGIASMVALKVDGTGGLFPAAGTVAHDAADSGNPVKVGGVARNADAAAVANGDRVDATFDLGGKLVVQPYAVNELLTQGATAAITDTSDTQVIAAAGAGLRNYITSITVVNSHATVGTVVEIKDGSTVIHRGYAPAVGGGYTITLPTPLRGTANTAINAACLTSGANVYVSASGFKAP